jgi:hypothetical protein
MFIGVPFKERMLTAIYLALVPLPEKPVYSDTIYRLNR